MSADGEARDDRASGVWGARFGEALAPEADALNRSLPLDRRLWREELEVAAAWTEALADLGVLGDDQVGPMLSGIERVGARLADGVAEGAPDEDIHGLVERLLTDELGDQAGVLRTGRSRNDTASTATRLWLMRAVDALTDDLRRLQTALLQQGEATLEVLAPAYTHLQRAQPIRFAQFFLSHFWALQRDRERLLQARKRVASLPLGAAAISGSGFSVDRERLRRRLGFESLMRNSMDAVSDRDYVADVAAAGALLGVHLSRLAEDLILFASAEFGFVRFADAYSTGSSLMPQKRNPDIVELARGQAARLLGQVTAALSLLKGVPGGYNKDFQEDKPILFAVYDILHRLLPAFAGALETLRVDPEAAAGALEPAMLAVDVADELVRAGFSFRVAHAAVGALVREAESAGVSLFELPKEQVTAIHTKLPAALQAVGEGGYPTAYERSVEVRGLPGGTARAAVEAQIEDGRAAITR